MSEIAAWCCLEPILGGFSCYWLDLAVLEFFEKPLPSWFKSVYICKLLSLAGLELWWTPSCVYACGSWLVARMAVPFFWLTLSKYFRISCQSVPWFIDVDVWMIQYESVAVDVVVSLCIWPGYVVLIATCPGHNHQLETFLSINLNYF